MSGSPGSAGGSDATPPCSLRGTPLAVRSDGRGCGLWLATTAYFHMATRSALATGVDELLATRGERTSTDRERDLAGHKQLRRQPRTASGGARKVTTFAFHS